MASSKDLNIVVKAKDEATNTFGKIRGELGSLTSSFFSSTLGVAAIAGSLGYLGKKMVEAAAEFEQTKVAFTTMLGSAEKANTLLRDLADFASKTPFELQGIEKSAKQLLAFGFAEGEVVKQLKMMGDLSAGLSVPIEQLVYAYGQVRAANQLYGTELRQFVNAGVPLLAELARMYGVTEAEAKKMVEEGKVGFKDVEQAFENMTEAGGRFHDLMAEQSKTLLGRISNLKDSWNIFLREQGNGLIVWAGMFVDKLSQIVEWLKRDAQGINLVGQTIFGLIKFFEALGKSVWAVALIFGGFIKSVIEGAKVTYAFVKDGINNFKNFGNVLKNIFQAIGEAFKGNFSEAKDIVKKTVKESLSNTIAQFEAFSNVQDDISFGITEGIKSAGKSWVDFATLQGFDSTIEKFGKLGEAIKTNVTTVSDEASKKASDSFSKLQEKIQDFAAKSADEIDSVAKKITEIQDKMNELVVGKVKTDMSESDSLATAYVNQEKKVNDLKEKIRQTEEGEQRNKLENELRIEQEALDRHKSIQLAYDSEIQEQRRRASLTEFERIVEDWQKKQNQLSQEYEFKMNQLQKELLAEQQKMEALKEIQAIGLVNLDKFLAQSEIMTTDSINREIDKYNELAKAIARAKSGQTSGYLNVGQEVENRANQTAPTVNVSVTGNTLLDSRSGEKVGDMIIKKLSLSNKL